MLDIYAPLTPDARRQTRVAYRQFLADRDGTLDLENRTLSRREERMAHYASTGIAPRALDRPLFDAQYKRFDRRVETSQEMLLLLTLVKANAAEAYGVNAIFDKVYRRVVKKEDDLEVLLLIEEGYHTRILLSAAKLYDVEITQPFLPTAALRTLIGALGIMPESVSRPLSLAGEVLGTLTFLKLLEVAGRVLKHDPELRDQVEERIVEVLVDEIGHISFNRTCLGAAGLACASKLLPIVATMLGDTMPELRMLGIAPQYDTSPLVKAPGGIPETVRRAAFIA